MLLAVHFLRFSCIFYPRAESRGFDSEEEQTEMGRWAGGLYGRGRSGTGRGIKRITSFDFRLWP